MNIRICYTSAADQRFTIERFVDVTEITTHGSQLTVTAGDLTHKRVASHEAGDGPYFTIETMPAEPWPAAAPNTPGTLGARLRTSIGEAIAAADAAIAVIDEQPNDIRNRPRLTRVAMNVRVAATLLQLALEETPERA